MGVGIGVKRDEGAKGVDCSAVTQGATGFVIYCLLGLTAKTTAIVEGKKNKNKLRRSPKARNMF